MNPYLRTKVYIAEFLVSLSAFSEIKKTRAKSPTPFRQIWKFTRKINVFTFRYFKLSTKQSCRKLAMAWVRLSVDRRGSLSIQTSKNRIYKDRKYKYIYICIHVV